MPPLISLETSPLKYDAPTAMPEDAGRLGLEIADEEERGDSNIIRFSGLEMLRRETAEADVEEPEEYCDSKFSYYSQLFENSPAAIVLLDTYDHVIDLNPAFTRIFQYTEDEIRNFPLTNFIVPRGRMKEAIEMTLRTLRGEPVLQTLQRKRKDGTVVEVEMAAFPVRLAGSRIGIFTVYTDVSQKRLAERRKGECEKYESIGVLAEGAARNFNAVLGVLMAGTKQLRHAMRNCAAHDNTFIEMNAALDRGVELIGRLIAFAGKSVMLRDAADAESRLHELAAMMQSLAGTSFPDAAR